MAECQHPDIVLRAFHYPNEKGVECLACKDVLWVEEIEEKAEPRETLTASIHAFFESWNEGGCRHFDRGYGAYAECEDPEVGIPIGELHRILPTIDVDRLAQAVELEIGSTSDEPLTPKQALRIAQNLALEYSRLS